MTQNISANSKNNWQQEFRKTLSGAQDCNAYLKTDAFKDHTFPIKIPRTFANLIDKKNPLDPLLRQVIPLVTKPKINFTKSPLDENTRSPVASIIYKYKNRVLLIASSLCAIHCRYCFRQNFHYEKHNIFSHLTAVKAYLSKQRQLNEVILSGGDPLSLSDEKLAILIHHIADIDHIQTLRIHTRTAVVIPSRITDKLADLLQKTRLRVVLVFHINHPQEISSDFKAYVQKLSTFTRLNQSVLLRGVNDNIAILNDLSLALFALGILPYYLHQLDKVAGSEHFLVSDNRARSLHQEMKKTLSGYLVPKLVRDDNKCNKTWL